MACMISLSPLPAQKSQSKAATNSCGNDRSPECYGVTIFTTIYSEVRSFYTEILDANVISERGDKACVLEIGGMPFCLRQTEHGEQVSYFHLYLEVKDQEHVLSELRHRGIIVTSVGPYNNFRDPEGRIIKLSESKTIVC